MASDENDWSVADAAWAAGGESGLLEKRFYRMPLGFGPSPGPRNLPLGKGDFASNFHSVSLRVIALTDETFLKQILPPGVELRGDPELIVSMNCYRDVHWLAGMSYVMLAAGVPVTATGAEGSIKGNYWPVEWHRIPDNVMTAREELGWPALWADISDPRARGRNAFTGHAAWMGFRFFDLEITDLGEPHVEPPVPDVQITYKYIPKGYTEGWDVSRLIINDLSNYWRDAGSVKDAEAGRQIQGGSMVREGTGRFQFNRARWEDMPSQYHVVNTLAKLPLLEFRRATVSSTAPH